MLRLLVLNNSVRKKEEKFKGCHNLSIIYGNISVNLRPISKGPRPMLDSWDPNICLLQTHSVCFSASVFKSVWAYLHWEERKIFLFMKFA